MFKKLRGIFSKKTKETDHDHEKEDALLTQVNQELYKRNAELAVRNKTLALLRKLDEISMSSAGMEDMARQITTVIAQELGYEIVAISLIEGSKEGSVMRWLSITSPLHEVAVILGKIGLNVGSSLRASEVLKLESQVVEGYENIYPPLITAAVTKDPVGKKITHSLIFQLSIGHQALGVLALSSARDLHNLTEYEKDAISGIIGLISLAIYKSKIYEDLQKTTQDLRQANESLAQVDKAKSEFLSIASHQLYTPLTAIKGYLSMLHEGDYGRVTKKMQPVVDILLSSSDRLIELIKNFLDVSRIESGRLALTLESVDLAGMAKDLVTELTPNAMKKELKLTFTASEENLPHVVADKSRLRQVLLNTVDNAIKYTPKGSVDVKAAKDGDFIIFSVQDTGKGISKEEIPRLFSKFTRVGGSDKYHTEGSGLGLYVARTIMHEHHGDIWVESPGLGMGSTFFVKLPIENTKDSLKAGAQFTVGIKTADVGQKTA